MDVIKKREFWIRTLGKWCISLASFAILSLEIPFWVFPTDKIAKSASRYSPFSQCSYPKLALKNMILLCLVGMLLSCNTSSIPELHVFIWSNYINPEVIAQFESRYKCRVVIDTYDSNESMYAKLKLGAVVYDILLPTDYYLDILRRQDMLRPLDKDLLPNVKYLDPLYTKMLAPTSHAYGVPYTVSNTGIGYRKDKVKEFVPSWDVFARSDLRGRMTMLNDMREALGAALKYLGYSLNTVNPVEVNEAAKLLIAWKKNLAKFENEQYKTGLASAEFLVVQGYSGDIVQVMQENSQVAFVLPKEGGATTIDSIVIPKDATHITLAHAFINFLLEPVVAAENMAYTFYLIPNVGAYELLPESLRTNSALFPQEYQLKKAEVIQDVGKDLAIYIHAWDQVKAAD